MSQAVLAVTVSAMRRWYFAHIAEAQQWHMNSVGDWIPCGNGHSRPHVSQACQYTTGRFASDFLAFMSRVRREVKWSAVTESNRHLPVYKSGLCLLKLTAQWLLIIALFAPAAHAQSTPPNTGRNEPTVAAIRLQFAAHVDAGCRPGFIIASGPLTQDAQSDTFAVSNGLALLPHPDTMAVKRLEQFVGEGVEVIIRPLR